MGPEPMAQDLEYLFLEYTPAIHRAFAPYGDKLGDLLGCGSFGCVWQIVRSNGELTPYAFKITTDPSEGPANQAILNTGLDKELDGLARIEGVWAFPDEESFAIVREAIAPWQAVPWLGELELRDFDAYDPQMGEEWVDWQRRGEQATFALNAYSIATFEWMKLVKLYGPSPLDPPGMKDSPMFLIAGAAKRRTRATADLYANPYTANLAQAIDELDRLGIHVYDLHTWNLGHRTHSWTPGQKRPKPLWPGGRLPPQREGKWSISAPPQFPLLVFDFGHYEAPATEVRPARENAVPAL